MTAWLQTMVPVRARGSTSCHFGPPLVLRPDGGVEIVEPDGSAVVVGPANVAAYPRAAMRGAGSPEVIPFAKDLADELPSTSGEVASPAKPPPPAGGVASSPVELSTGHVSVRTVDTDRASGIRINPVVQKGRR